MKEKVLYRATNATGPVHVLDRRWFWDNWPLLSPSHKLTAVAWTEFPSTQDVAQICIITRATSAEISHASRYEKFASTRRKYPVSNFGWAPHSRQTAVGNKKINLQRSTVVFALVICMIRPLTQAHRTILKPIQMAEKMNSIYKLPRNKTSCLHEP